MPPPIFNDDGTLDSIVGLHTDISERKLHQEQLERALVVAREMNEDQRRFVAIASHEFRTPLTIIDGAAQRIAAHLRAAKADESIPRRLGRIRAAVARMTGVIELMLSSARLDDGKLHLAPGPVNVTALLREVCDRQGQITPQFTIVTEQCPSDLIIEADGRLLDQVFTNLLSNAAKYSGSSQRIEICAKRQPGLVVVEIRDFGIGISAADLPRMFTRFFRAKSASGIQGTGIGLHFTRQLVLLHGGSIDVESELGRGSVFRVALPTTQAAALRSGLVAE